MSMNGYCCRLAGGPAPIEVEQTAGGVAAGAAGEVDCCALDLFWFAPAFEGHGTDDELLGLVAVRNRGIHLGEKWSRTDGVAGDA